MSLSFGYLLTDGEWEILTIFASYLGPAEGKLTGLQTICRLFAYEISSRPVSFCVVTAWGIFGTVWDGVNEGKH